MGTANPCVAFVLDQGPPIALFLLSALSVGSLTFVCGRDRSLWAGMLGLGASAVILGLTWGSSRIEDEINRRLSPDSQPVSITHALLLSLIFTGACAIVLMLVEVCRPKQAS